LALVALQTSTVAILYFLPSHQQVAVAVQLLVQLMLVVLAAEVHTAVVLEPLATHPLHHQAKETMVVLVVA